VYSQFNLAIPSDQVQSRNVAIVMVSASMSPFARSGDTLDVTVTSAGDARSLVGGSLLLTPLKGADGEVHALAQGPLTVGGYRYDANGNIVQKNHPTLGSIPGGATVEVGVESHILRENGSLTFVLAEPDYTTASRVARAINGQFRTELARARDASGIDIDVPAADRARLVDFLAKIENVTVEADRRARVVINERTGTLVSGGDVRISSVSISHGDLKLSVASQTSVSQPVVIGRAGDGLQTALVTNTRVDVDEPRGAGYLNARTTVADLVQALARMKVSTRDMISILRAVKAAGALHGELVVQ
jgi:flagellar P-ring protein precursor FlgI